MSNTDNNVGVRRFIYGSINEYRNFEPGGTTNYVSNSTLTIGTTIYNPGDALPLGILPDATLEVLWNSGQIDPAS